MNQQTSQIETGNRRAPEAGPRPRAALARVRGYETPRADPRIDLKLDANEGPAASADLVAALREIESRVVRRYPGPGAADRGALERAIADRLGLQPARVLVTAGGDEAIDRVCRAYLEPDREIVLPSPTFEMVRQYALLAGADVVEVPWWEGDYPVREVLARATERTAVIAVVSPNNPTGAAVRPQDLEELARSAPSALLLVDLAYTEFADEDLTPVALALPNAVVIRTLSKAWGMAGLRVGYALASEGVISVLRKAGGPFSVAGPSIAVALEVVRKCALAAPSRLIEQVRSERTELSRLLREIGAEPLVSQANFVLARFADAPGVHERLASRGIAVRRFGPGSPLADYLRITCPCDEAAMQRLAVALRIAAGKDAAS